MATVLQEQRAVVYLLWVRGHLAQVIHRDMLPVYGENRLFYTAVHSTVKKFPEGHSKLEDNDRLHYWVKITTKAAVTQVVAMISASGWVKTSNVVDATGYSHRSA
jgi:hypothetical protein